MTTDRWIEFCCWLVGETDEKTIRTLLYDWQLRCILQAEGWEIKPNLHDTEKDDKDSE